LFVSPFFRSYNGVLLGNLARKLIVSRNIFVGIVGVIAFSASAANMHAATFGNWLVDPSHDEYTSYGMPFLGVVGNHKESDGEEDVPEAPGAPVREEGEEEDVPEAPFVPDTSKKGKGKKTSFEPVEYSVYRVCRRAEKKAEAKRQRKEEKKEQKGLRRAAWEGLREMQQNGKGQKFGGSKGQGQIWDRSEWE
jgi:hypothetical protein